MSSSVAGIAFLLIFAASQAIRDAWFANVFQSVSFFIIILLGFGPPTIGFTAAEAVRDPRSVRILLCRKGRFAALNATTAMAWIGYFFALKYLEPAVVNALHTGVGPLAALAMAGAAPAVSALERGCYVGLAASLLALIAVVLSGQTGLHQANLAISCVAILAVLVGGVMIAVSHLIARRFNDAGASSSAIMGLRFLLTLATAGTAESLFGEPSLRPEFGSLGALLLAAIVLIGAPSFALQLGVARASPLAVNIIRSLGPVFVFAVQQADGRLGFSGATLLCIVAFSVFAIGASVLRAMAELRR